MAFNKWMIATIIFVVITVALSVLLSLSLTLVIHPEHKYLQRVTPQFANLKQSMQWNAPSLDTQIQNIDVAFSHQQIWWPSYHQPATLFVLPYQLDGKKSFSFASSSCLPITLPGFSSLIHQIQVYDISHDYYIAVRTQEQDIFIFYAVKSSSIPPSIPPTSFQLVFRSLHSEEVDDKYEWIDMIWNHQGDLILMSTKAIFIIKNPKLNSSSEMSLLLTSKYLSDSSRLACGSSATCLAWSEPIQEQWSYIEYDGWKNEYQMNTIQHFKVVQAKSTGFANSICMDDTGTRIFVNYIQPFDMIEHYFRGKHIQTIQVRPLPTMSSNPLIGYHMSCFGHYLCISAPGIETDLSGSIYIYTFDHHTNFAILPQHLMSEHAGMGTQVFLREEPLFNQLLCFYLSPQASQYGSIFASLQPNNNNNNK